MRRESYLSQPPEVETYPVFDGTDIILRQNMEQVEKEEQANKDRAEDDQAENGQTEEKRTYQVWECDETQYHYKGDVTSEEVTEKFAYWWSIAEGKTEIEALDKESEKLNEPTVAERLEALESGLAELAEVIANGEVL